MAKFKALQKPVNIGTAENPKWAFVMSTEAVNWYGFRVLSDGIELSAFELNPVSFFNHNFEDKSKEENRYPLGKWSNLRIEDGKLLGDFEPDMEDPEGVKLNKKIAGGFVNACSIFFRWVEWSESEDLMLPGQTGPTITKCLLLECSPVGLPANQQAIRLQLDGGEVMALSADTKPKDIQELFKQFSQKKNNDTEMKEILVALGLAVDATQADALNAISQLKATQTSDTDLKTVQSELEKLKADRVSALVQGALDAKKIDATQVANYTKLANVDFESTASALAAITPAPSLTDFAQGGKATGLRAGEVVATAESSKDCRFSQLSIDELEELQRTKPDEFSALQNEYLNLVKQGK
jgi:hypothetical protein